MKYETPIDIDYYTAKEAVKSLINGAISIAERYENIIAMCDENIDEFLDACIKRERCIVSAREAMIVAATLTKAIRAKAQDDVNAEREEATTTDTSNE